MVVEFNGAYAYLEAVHNAIDTVNNISDVRRKYIKADAGNRLTEELVRKDNIMKDVVMDYMIHNNTNSNAVKVYNTLEQDRINKDREIKINDYKSKVYIEYSNILKIVILLVILMIILLVLGKYEILSKNITLFIVIIVAFFAFIYVFYKLYLLYMKDPIEYNKDVIPYDITALKKHKAGTDGFKKKKFSSGMGLTCIGEDCCAEGMQYDSTQNKCFYTGSAAGAAGAAGAVEAEGAAVVAEAAEAAEAAENTGTIYEYSFADEPTTSKMNFEEANRNIDTANGCRMIDKADITDAEQLNRLTTFLSGQDINNTFWVNVKRKNEESPNNYFLWGDGSEILQKYWKNGEPNDYRNNEDNAVINREILLNDVNENDKAYVVQACPRR